MSTQIKADGEHIQIDGYYDMPESDAVELRQRAIETAQQLADQRGQTVEIYDGDTVVEAVYPRGE